MASFSDVKGRTRQLPNRNAGGGGKNVSAQTAAAVSRRLDSHKSVRILCPWGEKIINKPQLCATVGATHRRYFILWGCGPEPLLYFCSSGSPESVAFITNIHLGKSTEETFGNGTIDKKFRLIFSAEKIIFMYEWDNSGYPPQRLIISENYYSTNTQQVSGVFFFAKAFFGFIPCVKIRCKSAYCQSVNAMTAKSGLFVTVQGEAHAVNSVKFRNKFNADDFDLFLRIKRQQQSSFKYCKLRIVPFT